MIRKCIGCLVCLNEIFHHRHVKCSVNPTTGREREFARPERNGAGRIIAVIGGGPAGLTAALVLKERGFHPVLFDAARRLGGTLNVADKGIGKDKITRFIDSLIAQARETGIDLRLGEEATVAKVQALSPSGVFIACGARPFIPPVPGIDGGNVVLAEEVLLHPEEAKGDCVIIGSGMTGLETAEVVLKSGHRTTIVDLLPEIGAGADLMTILDAKQRMAPYHPTYLPGHKLTRITPEGAEFACLASGLAVKVAADTVILALGVRPQTELVARFKAAFPDAHVLGDASRGGRVVDATQDAYGQAFVYEP